MVVLETPPRGRRPEVHRLRTSQVSDRETVTQVVRRLSLSAIPVDAKTDDESRRMTSIHPAVSPKTADSIDNHQNLEVETKIYKSLPPSPVSLSPARSSNHTSSSKYQGLSTVPPFSIWDYLREELLATDFDSHQELKWERVSNFLSVPLAIEKVVHRYLYLGAFLQVLTTTQILFFGCILCSDSLLYSFTVLPIRFSLAVFRLLQNSFTRSVKFLPPSQKADILASLLIAFSIIILTPFTDISKIYHSIRGQETIKLYVIFNALEVRLIFRSASRAAILYDRLPIDCVLPLVKISLTVFFRVLPFFRSRENNGLGHPFFDRCYISF